MQSDFCRSHCFCYIRSCHSYPPSIAFYRLWWHCKCFCSGAVCGRFRARNCCRRLHNACRLSYLAQKAIKAKTNIPPGKAFRDSFLGHTDTGCHSWRNLRRRLYANGSRGSRGILWPFVGIFIYRTINSPKILFEIFSSSIRATAIVMIVVTCAGLYSWVASTVGLVEKGSALLLSLSDNAWVVLLMINIILLLRECCLTQFPSIMCFAFHAANYGAF